MQIPSWRQIQSGIRCDAIGGTKRRGPFDSNSPFVLRPNYAVLSSVLAALLFAASDAVQARMINAAGPSLADIRRAVASAADGDTVTVPAGTAVWTSALTITKGITIQGQTTVNSDTGVCNDQTVLLDNLGRVPGGQGFFHCKVNAGQSLRITGITFTGRGGLTETAYNGAIRIGGNSNQVRLDHLHFTNLYHTNYIAIYGNIRGVSDHVVEDNIPGQLGQQKVFNGAGSEGYGDEVWSQPAGYGGPDFFFFEDWYADNSGGAPFSANGGWDANTGGKFVIRHCHLYNIEILCHGTEGGRTRGGRAQEIYNNDYHWSYLTTMDGVRSGTLVVHDNTYDGVEPQGYGLQTYRMIFGYDGTWKGAHGANPWDYNATEADGSHIDGHSPYLFESGTVSSAVNSPNGTMTDSTKNWTPNQWNGYALRRPSDEATWRIAGNTNNTLNIYQWGDPCCIQNWRVNDTYEIHKVLQALDQPGAGASDPISGANPTPKWLHQVREGCYSWNNVYTPNGHHMNWRPASPGFLEGRDYFSDTPLSGYTPYTYPHPLTKGLPPPEQMTGNSTGNSQHNPLKKRQPWGGKQPDRKKAKKANEGPINKMADGQDNLGN